LDSPADRRPKPGERINRPRERHDAKNDLSSLAAIDRECRFAGLQVAGECAVSKREAVRLVRDIDDSAGQRRPEPNHTDTQNDRALVVDQGAGREDVNARSDLRFPTAERTDRAIEDLASLTEAKLISVMPIADRELSPSRGADLGIGRRSRSRVREQPVDVCL